MPLYEYYCPRCAAKFELLRPMSQCDEPTTCPEGHRGGTRTLSVFASVSRASGVYEQAPSSGACACGGGGRGCGR